MNALFDTNIIIDYLHGVTEAADELGRYQFRLISLVTWMEVLIGPRDNDQEKTIRDLLETFDVMPIDATVAESAVMLRRNHRLRLPDAIILATADTHQALLITRSTKDFPADRPGIRVPYNL